jgi:hypothetical protein
MKGPAATWPEAKVRRGSLLLPGAFAIGLLHDNTQCTFLFRTTPEGKIEVMSVTPAMVTVEPGRAR